MRFPSSVGGERAEEVGFIEHDTVELATWYAGAIDLVDVSGDYRWSSVRDLVRDLPIAPGGVTRRAFIPTGSGWTLLLTDGFRTDVAGLPRHSSRVLGCRSIRAVCTADDAMWPARMLTVVMPASGGGGQATDGRDLKRWGSVVVQHLW